MDDTEGTQAAEALDIGKGWATARRRLQGRKMMIGVKNPRVSGRSAKTEP